jgi:hypothetical protein
MYLLAFCAPLSWPAASVTLDPNRPTTITTTTTATIITAIMAVAHHNKP